MNHLRFIH